MEKKLMTAKSYANAEIIKEYEKNGKMYGIIKEKCDRCNGRGDYWWGAMINGRPQFSGTCYQCNGARYFTKEVRLYTEEEYNKMEATKEKNRQKKVEEQKKKMEAEFETNRIKWLEENGFNTDEVTYIYAGADSYQIKDELKDAGFHFSSTLKWHKPTRDEKYANNLIEVKLSDIAEWSAWGKASFNRDSQKIVEEKIAETQPKVDSNWIGEVGDKITNIKVQLIRKYTMDGKYGVTTLYGFQDENGNIINWWSSTFQEVELNDWVMITRATIKKLDEYKGVKQTIITRAKLGQISD